MLSLTRICLKGSKASHSIDNSVLPSYHYFLRDGEMEKTHTDFLFLWLIQHGIKHFRPSPPCAIQVSEQDPAVLGAYTTLPSNGRPPRVPANLWQTPSRQRGPRRLLQEDHHLFNLFTVHLCWLFFFFK